MNIQQIDTPDCTNRCRSSQHGDIITAAISKRSVSDSELCSYMNYICCCCESVKDSCGRNALHVAASCGRLELVRWLIQCRHANINAKDDESGYTALHRSIFYGKINVAVELIKLGANISLLDSNSLLMLEHAMKDNIVPDENIYDGELYVWGSNTNNCLGPQQARASPELLDVFHKEHPNECVNQIYVDKFHSLIVTGSGKVFSCGHAQGGRLGLGVENTVVTPKQVIFPESSQVELLTCIQASISRDHSIFLMSDGNIFTCGLNTHKVLGLSPPPPQATIPKPIKHIPKEITGVCSGRYHSVAWGPNGLYTWGLNAGQLGHKSNNSNEDHYIITPRIVGILNTTGTVIKCVASSDGAIVVYTTKGDIYVLHEYQCRKIASRHLNLIQLSIIGGKLDTTLDKTSFNESSKELKIVALTNHGNILMWQESDPHLCRCIFSINRNITVKQVKINLNGLLFVTYDGEAFQGVTKPRKKKSESDDKNTFHKFLEKELCIYVKISKFQRIHRAIYITSDPTGHDYCVIQAYPYKTFEFPQITKSEMKDHFNHLLNEAHETDDIHDVIFKVGRSIFPAHRYIVALKSPHLEKLMSKGEEIISLEDYNPHIFEQFLQYTYTGTCDLLKYGPCPERLLRISLNTENITNFDVEVDDNISAFEFYSKHKHNKQRADMKKTKNPVRMLQELAKKLGCIDLQNALGYFDMYKNEIKSKTEGKFKTVPLKFSRDLYPELHDVIVKCRDNKEICAHKCILAARLEYFNNMFSGRWNGKETTEIYMPFPKSIVEALLEFLYTDTLSYLNNMELDHLFKVLMLADQLFVIRLKEQCEQLLTNQLNLKNCIQLLTFANIYNAESLKQCCMKFIVSNLAPFLELRLLEDLPDDVLDEITKFYFNENKEIWCRVITPYSTAPPDEDIIHISTMCPIALDHQIEKGPKSTQKRRSRTHRSINTETNTKTVQFNNSHNAHNDSIIQFPDGYEEANESSIHERLQAIQRAQNRLREEESEVKFIKLKSISITSSGDEDTTLDISASSMDFPELSSPNNSYSSYSKSPHKHDSTKYKILKISQKQRKRLSSKDSSKENIQFPESPKNPWKLIPNVNSVSPQDNKANASMNAIISAEKKQRENLVKMRSKLLIYTQMEDKAIEELHKFYNTENIMDEIITIERVDIGAVAVPTWVPRNK